MGTIHESSFGQLLRLLTNDGVLLYPEERDPDLWYSYIITDGSPSTPAVFEGKDSAPTDLEKDIIFIGWAEGDPAVRLLPFAIISHDLSII